MTEDADDVDDPGQPSVPDDTEIQPLDQDTIAKIAAGEVVERPASVAKELVENAIDAGASRVEVAVENGGLDRVEVRDDGVGMAESDLRAAVREHTTSKLTDADELESVSTLGFRGEALHTIGAVANLELIAKPNPGPSDDAAGTAPDTGTRLIYRGGDVETVEPAAHPGGTTVIVTDLFHNTPARRKYLSEPATEFRHVSRVVGRYALANPDVAISLTHDGREVFATTGDGDRVAAIMAVYGREVAESMIDVDVEPDTDAVARVHGHVSEPETTRASREYLATYVNDRAVASDTVRGAIVEAYGRQLSAERYPFAVLFVDIPPGRVDVNVHPRKQAVRFDEEGAVEDAVTDAVRDALLDAGIVRASAPRGASEPAETSVPSDDSGPGGGDPASTTGSADDANGERERTDATSPQSTDPDGTAPASTDTESGTDPASAGGATKGSAQSVDAASDAASAGGAAPDAVPADDADSSTAAGGRTDGDEPEATTAATDGTATDEVESVIADTLGDPSRSDTPQAGDWTDQLGARVEPSVTATDQRTLDGESVSARSTEFDRLPPLRVLGQHADTYLVAEGPDGLLLIDQHAADERIHYERLREAVDSGTAQALADPVELSLTPTEAETYDEYAPALRRLGFHADREERTLTVRSVPTVLGETLDPNAIRDVFGSLLAGGDGEGTVEAMADELLGDLACAPAVKGNTSLTEGSVTSLLSALDDCDNPFACPHGRPTIVRIDGDELADRFERDYPGHGSRRD
ncbi:hypothetical protein GCM10028857_15520 [Salinarchaeum chitinilyticum]